MSMKYSPCCYRNLEVGFWQGYSLTAGPNKEMCEERTQCFPKSDDSREQRSSRHAEFISNNSKTPMGFEMFI